MKIKLILFLVMTNLIFSFSGNTYRYGFSARSHSLANALVADNYMTFQSFYNPSSLNQSNGQNFGISYFRMSLDRSIQSFYYSRSLPGSAGLSLSILRAGVDSFMGKDSFNNPTNELSLTDYYGIMSFGLKGIGMSIKMHYSNLNVNEPHIDKYIGNSIVLDFGWSHTFNENLRLGFKLENLINSSLSWDINIGDGLSHAYEEDYPLIASLGSSYQLNKNHLFLFHYEQINYNDNYNLKSRIGYEFISNNHYMIRIGLVGKDEIRLGFGYNFFINDKFPMIMDYSLDLGSNNEGISHLMTWRYSL